MNIIEKARKILEKSYEGRCNIYVYPTQEDEYGITKTGARELLESNIPCSLSFKQITATEQGYYGTTYTEVKLFLSPFIDVPLNSTIEVIQNSRTAEYKHSGRAALYDTHQEIILNSDEAA